MPFKQLWFWGMLCILAGTVGAAVSQSLFPHDRPATRAEAAGAAFGQVFLIAVGLVLLVIHFSRRLRQGATEQLPSSGRVSVVCPRCDHSMRIARSALGKWVRCGDCDVRFVARGEDDEDSRDEEVTGSTTGALVGVIASSVALLLAVAGMVWLAIRGLSDETPSSNNPVPVQRPPLAMNPLPGNNPVPENLPPLLRPPVVAPGAAAVPVVTTPEAVLVADEGPVDRLGISPDGKTLLSASRLSFSLWNVEAGNNRPRDPQDTAAADPARGPGLFPGQPHLRPGRRRSHRPCARHGNGRREGPHSAAGGEATRTAAVH